MDYRSFDVVEWDLSKGQSTGRVLSFTAKDVYEAREDALYYALLSNGRAQRGNSDRVVYPKGIHADLCWIVSIPKTH